MALVHLGLDEEGQPDCRLAIHHHAEDADDEFGSTPTRVESVEVMAVSSSYFNRRVFAAL